MCKPIRSLLTLAATITALIVAPGTAAARQLIVRAFDTTGISREDMAIAQAAAADILKEADLTLDWRDCSAACDAAPESRAIVLRIVRAPKTAEAGPLGYSLVDVRTGRGALATVYADRIALTAVRTRLGMGMLLGRAAAHEIGHLLLGTNEHADRGLMRALWSDRELRRDQAADWVLSPDVIERLLQR